MSEGFLSRRKAVVCTHARLVCSERIRRCYTLGSVGRQRVRQVCLLGLQRLPALPTG